MLNIRIWMITLGSFLAVSFTICVLGGVLFPGLQIKHVVLESLLPGFRWISFGAFALGFAESFLFGAYAGLMIGVLHNFVTRRLSTSRAALSVTRVA
jgi:hypothetical protein